MKTFSALSLLLTASLVAAVACTTATDSVDTVVDADGGTADATTLAPPETVSVPVSAATGGTVTLPGPTADTVEIPAGALAADTTVGITQADPAAIAPEPDQMDLVSRPVILTPHGTTFSTPVTLKLAFNSTAPAANLVVMRLDNETDTSWEIVPGGTFENGKATIQVTHFSIYAVGTRLDDAATCDKVCPTIVSCLESDDNCNKGCGEARLACTPTEWKRLVDCFNAAVAKNDCQAIETCIKSEQCTQRDEDNNQNMGDGGMMGEGGMGFTDGGMFGEGGVFMGEAGMADSGPGEVKQQPGKQ